jgi:uncharacterized protein involved in exopolysaccharide biosynthesis
MAADLANIWADTLVKEGNRIYGENEDDVAFLQEQLEQARQILDQAESALVEFEARNESNLLNTQIDALGQAQADYLADQQRLDYLIQGIEGLRDQLTERPQDEAVTLGDSLTTFFLQIQAFNAETSIPIQLQLESADAISEKTVAEQITFLNDLVTSLEERSNGLDQRLAELEPLILSLQQAHQETKAESNWLNRSRDLAEETYMTLARKVDEARIAVQEGQGTLQVGSYAAVPQRPAGPRKKIITAVAGMLGLLVGVVGALAIDFWRQSRR